MGVRLLALVVLFGLFTLHVVTAHGSSHHQGPTSLSAALGLSTSHGGAHHAAPVHTISDSPPAPDSPPGNPGSITSQPPGALVAPVSMGAPTPITAAEMLMCWLLLSAGLILVIGLLRFRRAAADTAAVSRRMPGPGRAPRAPHGRQRLHQLTVLQV
ncbi:hypothetical protein FDO65_04230 [Nakamurella flava]|uniref:Uncharacterized protein n=1 Tax=Nakamurella flava TaxID=2576308 RepID=A0A4U6QKR6_9ACTN|nr:hypothetical protein [Nakamurella flava]TKV60879.1 hypothetical protein FDO65_04230 [Nakamurella flava]